MRIWFTHGLNTVMTTYAIVREGTVIHRGRYPRQYPMTNVTFIRGLDVQTVFTGGDYPVMATGTNSNDIGVIDCTGGHRQPRQRAGRMAGVTAITAIDVVSILPRGDEPIVTADTTGADFLVIYRSRCNWYPGNRGRQMTGLAYVGCRHVGVALTGCGHAIVATEATTTELVMIHRATQHRNPRYGSRLMAGLAQVGGTDVIITLATGHNAVMTTDAATTDLGVIHCARRNRCPLSREFFMAGVT